MAGAATLAADERFKHRKCEETKCRTNPMVSGGTCFEVHHSGFMSESDANFNVSRGWRSGSRLDEVQFPKVNGMQCRRHSAKGWVTVPRGSAVLPKIPVTFFQLENGCDVAVSQPGGVRATVLEFNAECLRRLDVGKSHAARRFYQKLPITFFSQRTAGISRRAGLAPFERR